MDPDKQYNIFENINLGIGVYEVKNDGKDLIIKDFNPTAALITNTNVNDVLGKNIVEVFPGVKEMGLTDALLDVWKNDMSKELATKEYKDGKLHTFFENFIYKLPSGFVVAVFRDTTKNKITEEVLNEKINELEKLNKLMIGRELNLIELKKKNAELQEKISAIEGNKQ